MIKNKTILYLIVSIVFLQLSFPCFAMLGDNEDEDVRAVGAVQQRMIIIETDQDKIINVQPEEAVCSFSGEVLPAGNFAIVTYNLAMGIPGNDEKRKNGSLMTKSSALTSFAEKFNSSFFKPNVTWFICVQEINCNDPSEGNQVEKLQGMLQESTKCEWYNSYNTQRNKIQGAVAVFSNKQLVETKRWNFQNRVAVAVNSSDNIWVVTTHLIKPDLDIDGMLRGKMLRKINKKMQKFDNNTPQILCGDLNIYDTAEGSFSKSVEEGNAFSENIFKETVGYLIKNGFQRGRDFTPSARDATFHSWNKTTNRDRGHWGIIDYIFVRNINGRDITKPKVLNFQEGKKYISDHKGLLIFLEP